MSGRRRQSLSPNLFPFLAVLVCTLGTLILLLALVAQNTATAAREIAETAAKETRPSDDVLTVGQVNDLVEEESFRLEQLVSFRDGQTQDLERRRNQLAHVEDHMRRIRVRLDEIMTAIKKADEDQTDSTAAEEIASLQKEIDDKASTVDQLRSEVQTEKPRFVIVPHQGLNGTGRRPIYLECHAGGVTIWPENVELSMWQLEQASTEANPLDEALRAARYHAMNHYGDQDPPYPMLLVRPGGVEAYYAARAAMTEWEDQFGYELVPDGIELAYPKPDAAMKEKMLYAIKNATEREQRYSIARSAGEARARFPGNGTLPENLNRPSGRSNGDGNSPSGTASNHRSAPRKPLPSLSVAEMDRSGRRSGFRDHRSLPMSGYGAGSGYNSGSYNSSSVTADDAKRRLERMMDDGADEYASENDLAQSQLESPSEQPQERSGQQSGFGMSDPFSAQAQQAASDDLALDSRSQGQPSLQQELFTPGAMYLPDATEQTQQSGEAGYSDTASRQMNGKEATATEGSTTMAFGQTRSSDLSANQSSQQSQAAKISGKSPEANSQSQAQAAQSQSGQQQLVERSGSDWGLPDSVAFGKGNEIIRHVRLLVYPDRFVLPAARGASRVETFAMAPEGSYQATLKMATAVRDRIGQWGATAPGSRWSPRLKVVVMPGAEQQFEQMRRLMIGSGVPVEVEPTSQASADTDGGLR
ncbi:hypothetical protein [Rhodopirellula sp. MGV]|uniref:hypothetical protein n=1 Tax=Rhodopirellula sp. MGV TaxID=2023130 RepID=UPI000B964D81|nr:hypothetical protein [Rhodopirellula sp. MGV]OYP29814.1 hypothetical protein CGZ80_23755 [Rhodopirellula sp. MGV]PNY33696.1 hypothetical protein C2E31_26735 [Rhodopirellula baltica]